MTDDSFADLEHGARPEPSVARSARPEPKTVLPHAVEESKVAPSARARELQNTLSHLSGIPGVVPLAAGVLAIFAASVGQYILRPGDAFAPNADITTATRWYSSGIVILLAGWWGTYRRRSLLRFPSTRAWVPIMSHVRLVLVGLALLSCLLSLLVLRGDWGSLTGGLLWLLSLLLLVAAFVREKDEVAPTEKETDTDGWRLSRRAELAVFSAIMVLSLALRLWRLGDLAPGMHGDEGEAGTDALSILQGTPAPLFGRGWFNQPNMYYWSVAIGMKIFGTGLFGLRAFALLCGMATVVFTYLVGREMFGHRGAIIAGSFMAFQSAGLEFSRAEFSNASTPALLAAAFYFALRGLRTRRHLDFVLSGFASGFSLYFFAGGRLTAPVLAIFFLYLAVVRVRFVKYYWSRVSAYAAGLLVISMPWAAYYIAYPIVGLQYPNDRFIWLHHADLAGKYGSADWRTIVWDQLQATVSIITQSVDASALNALTFPIARPIEAPLIVLGLAWALWRCLDTRFFALSLWFWSSIIVGGVITIDAPNLPRIMAMLPVLPLVIAAVLDHLSVQVSHALNALPKRLRPFRVRWIPGIIVALGFIVVGALENWQMYIVSYLNSPQSIVTTAQAAYVQNQGYVFRFYGMGAPVIYWTHGDNRFINSTADGVDAGNISQYLPITDNGATGTKPANFLVWAPFFDYLPVLHAYYPAGITHKMLLGDAQNPNDPLIGYVVPAAQIEAHRTVGARFVDANGVVVSRRQTTLGLSGVRIPAPLTYPVTATWDGSLFADTYGAYRFHVIGPPRTEFTIDGVPGIFGRGTTTRTVVLARGLHAVHLFAVVGAPNTRVAILWSSHGGPLTPVTQRSLWDDNTVRGWNGLVRSSALPGGVAGPTFIERRVDGFLGYRNAGQLFGSGPLDGRWSSILTVTKPGPYGFRLNVSGDVSMRVDGRTVLHGSANTGQPALAEGRRVLGAGRHRLDIRIHWPGPFDYLEAYWAPPGKPYSIMYSPTVQPQQPAIESSTPLMASP